MKITAEGHSFVYFSVLNPAFESLTLNWLCNVAEFNVSLKKMAGKWNLEDPQPDPGSRDDGERLFRDKKALDWGNFYIFEF